MLHTWSNALEIAVRAFPFKQPTKSFFSEQSSYTFCTTFQLLSAAGSLDFLGTEADNTTDVIVNKHNNSNANLEYIFGSIDFFLLILALKN